MVALIYFTVSLSIPDVDYVICMHPYRIAFGRHIHTVSANDLTM